MDFMSNIMVGLQALHGIFNKHDNQLEYYSDTESEFDDIDYDIDNPMIFYE